MAGNIMWDIEEMNAQLGRFRNEKESLENDRDFLKNLKEEVRTNWKSMAGTEYENNLEIDFQAYLKLIEGLDSGITHLDKIANQIYAECENSIRDRLVQLASRMG